jgi:hypothetical protein
MSGSNSSGPVAAPTPDPLAMTVHSAPSPQLPIGERQRRSGGRFTALLVLLACLAPVIVSYFTYYVWRPSGRNNYADLIQPTRGIPEGLGLHSLDGQPVASASLKGQWLLLVVAGGECDRRCEDHLYAQRQLREMSGRERDRIDRLWLVVDEAPLRTPIAHAVTTGDAPATALRVSREALQRWLQPAPGQALEDHLYLVDPMGEWMMRAPAALEPKLFHKDLDRLLRASAFWDRAGRER